MSCSVRVPLRCGTQLGCSSIEFLAKSGEVFREVFRKISSFGQCLSLTYLIEVLVVNVLVTFSWRTVSYCHSESVMVVIALMTVSWCMW